MQEQTTPEEEWRQVVLDGEIWPYEISNLGTLRRTEGTAGGTHPGKVIEPDINGLGYYRVRVCNNGKQKRILLHRLVLMSFSRKPGKGEEANHINGNKADNSLANLEWVTSSENKKHAFRLGLYKPACGEAHPFCKLSDAQVQEIRALAGTMSQSKIGAIYAVEQSHISSIIRGTKRRCAPA